jgi:AraC-like DNA-binding protein
MIFPGAIIQGLAKYYEKQGEESSLPSLLKALRVTEDEIWSKNFNFDGNHALILLRRMKNMKSKIPVQESLSFFSWSSTGVVGLAALSSATLEEAIDVGLKFGHLYMPVIKADFIKDASSSKIVFSLLTDFEEMTATASELIICGFKKIVDEMSDSISDCTIHFAHSCSTGQSDEEASNAYSQFLGCPVVFNSDFSGFEALNSFWEKPLKSSNRVTRTMALDILKQQNPPEMLLNTLGMRVKEVLMQAAEKDIYLSLNELSDILHMTPRTVMRKLSNEGFRFKDMLNDIRFEKAKQLLTKSDTPITAIAEQVGFKDSNAFIRAFKRYSGHTANNWRQNNR